MHFNIYLIIKCIPVICVFEIIEVARNGHQCGKFPACNGYFRELSSTKQKTRCPSLSTIWKTLKGVKNLRENLEARITCLTFKPWQIFYRGGSPTDIIILLKDTPTPVNLSYSFAFYFLSDNILIPYFTKHTSC